MLAEQNATNWPLAEESLARAIQIDPRNELVIEYLCALYFAWSDPLGESDRMDEAKEWLERLTELCPEHRYANFYCGMILSSKARKLLPNYGQYPAPPEPDLVSLRRKAGPLLEEATQHLSRALALHGEQTAASYVLGEVRSMQTYLADPEKSRRELLERAEELFHKHVQGRKTHAQAQEDEVESGPSATITFHLSPEALAEDRARPFPPNPWRIPER